MGVFSWSLSPGYRRKGLHWRPSLKKLCSLVTELRLLQNGKEQSDALDRAGSCGEPVRTWALASAPVTLLTVGGSPWSWAACYSVVVPLPAGPCPAGGQKVSRL